MIYKNFYNKYKMSKEFLKQNDNQSNEDIDKEPEIIKESSNEEPKQKEILLQLGDIILISDPSNEILNDNVFLIEYIAGEFCICGISMNHLPEDQPALFVQSP